MNALVTCQVDDYDDDDTLSINQNPSGNQDADTVLTMQTSRGRVRAVSAS